MLTLILVVLGISFDSRAQAPDLPREGQYKLGAEISHFTSENNYGTVDGTSVVPSVGNFTNTQAIFQMEYDLQSALRVYGSATLASSQSDNDFVTKSESGLSELAVGAQYWVTMSHITLVPQGDFVYPAFRVDEESDTALIGEGAMRARGGSWIFLRAGQLRPFSYLGFEYRDEGRAFLLPYRVGAQFKTQTWWAQAEYRGFQTVVNDANDDSRDLRGVYLRRVDGGSLKFFSINPSLGEIAVEAGFPLGPVHFKAGMAVTINGNNSAEGWTALAGLSYSPGAQELENAEPNRNFELKTDRYDKSLFEDNVTPSTAPAPPKKRKKTRKQPKLDQLLKDTQKALENQ